MKKRRRRVAILMMMGIAMIVLSKMPEPLDKPNAYPELNRPMPWQVQILFPGELCDSLDKTLRENVRRFKAAAVSERPVFYDQVLEARAELTKYGCTVP